MIGDRGEREEVLADGEAALLQALVDGLSLEQAAQQLGLGPDEARARLERAEARLGVGSALELAFRALERGLIRRPS
jgi:DNA-binding CsgD family transcriptional regulator